MSLRSLVLRTVTFEGERMSAPLTSYQKCTVYLDEHNALQACAEAAKALMKEYESYVPDPTMRIELRRTLFARVRILEAVQAGLQA